MITIIIIIIIIIIKKKCFFLSIISVSQLKFGKLVFVEGGKPSDPEKNHPSQDNNQQQTQTSLKFTGYGLVALHKYHCIVLLTHM